MGRKRDDNLGEKSKKGDGKQKERKGRLEQNTISYYRRVQGTLEDGFEGQEEKELFLGNVYNQLSEELLQVSQNQTVSSIVERLIPEANVGQCSQMLHSLAADWETAVTDRFACYVTQTLLLTSWKRLCSDCDDSERSACEDEILGLHCEAMSELPRWMQHAHATHTVRTLLEVMGGAKVAHSVVSSKKTGKYKQDEFAHCHQVARFKKPFYAMCEAIVNLKMLKVHVESTLSNPVLQTLVLVVKTSHSDILHGMCEKIIEHLQLLQSSADGDDSVPELCSHDIGSHFIQTLVSALPSSLYERCVGEWSSHLSAMARHPHANFIVRQIVLSAHDKQQFGLVFNALCPHLEDTLGLHHIGIITALVEGCVTHNVLHRKMIQALHEAFHCHSPEERQSYLIPLLLSLSTYEVYTEALGNKASEHQDPAGSAPDSGHALPDITYHGSVIVQHLLRFYQPQTAVLGVMGLSCAALLRLGCHVSGGHTIEALVHSETVTDKAKAQLYRKLQGLYVPLACDKSGSRVVDTLFTHASHKHRALIASELSGSESRLRGDQYGHHVWRNCGLHSYVHRRNEWDRLQQGQAKKRAIMEGVIQGQGKKSKRKSVEAGSTPQQQQTGQGTDGQSSDTETPLVKKQKMEVCESTETTDTQHTESKKKKKKKKKSRQH